MACGALAKLEKPGGSLRWPEIATAAQGQSGQLAAAASQGLTALGTPSQRPDSFPMVLSLVQAGSLAEDRGTCQWLLSGGPGESQNPIPLARLLGLRQTRIPVRCI